MTLKWYKLDNTYLISEQLKEYPYYLIRLNNSKVCEQIRHDGKGYVRVLYYGRYVRFHRLIYKYFNGEIPTGYVIDHIDHVRDNNRIENLRCITQRENMQNLKTEKWVELNSEDLIPLTEFKGRELVNYYVGLHGVYKSNTQKYRLLKDDKLTDVKGEKLRINKVEILNKLKMKRMFKVWREGV